MKPLILLGVLISLNIQTALALDKPDAPVSIKDGRYAKKIQELSDRWRRPETNLNVTEKQNELNLKGIRTPDDSTYIGILAKTLVNSKLADLLKVLRDVGAYKEIYPGLDEVTFDKGPADDFEIHWKFSGPLGTHTIYDTIQKISQATPTKGALVYRLKKSDDVLDTDGFIFLQEQGDATKYLSVDFFNAKWGAAGTFFKNKIWETTFDNTKRATEAIKSAAEKQAKPSGAPLEKVLESYSGVVDREKQKTFENPESEIFGADTSTPTHIQ